MTHVQHAIVIIFPLLFESFRGGKGDECKAGFFGPSQFLKNPPPKKKNFHRDVCELTPTAIYYSVYPMHSLCWLAVNSMQETCFGNCVSCFVIAAALARPLCLQGNEVVRSGKHCAAVAHKMQKLQLSLEHCHFSNTGISHKFVFLETAEYCSILPVCIPCKTTLKKLQGTASVYPSWYKDLIGASVLVGVPKLPFKNNEWWWMMNALGHFHFPETSCIFADLF